MNSTPSPQPRDWREARRFRAWELKQRGWKQRDIAEALGVTPGAVSQWLKAAREGGEDALRNRRAPGPRPRLTPEQLAEIPNLLVRGAEYYGFTGDLWTTIRIAAVIRGVFGVSYHRDHVGRLLKSMGWSGRKPIPRATWEGTAAGERQAERKSVVKRGAMSKVEPSPG